MLPELEGCMIVLSFSVLKREENCFVPFYLVNSVNPANYIDFRGVLVTLATVCVTACSLLYWWINIIIFSTLFFILLCNKYLAKCTGVSLLLHVCMESKNSKNRYLCLVCIWWDSDRWPPLSASQCWPCQRRYWVLHRSGKRHKHNMITAWLMYS